MKVHLAMLLTDWLIYGLLLLAIIFILFARRSPHLREPWQRVLHNRMGMVAATLLSFYVIFGLLDSIHFEITYPKAESKVPQVRSLLDLALYKITSYDEDTYSAPFALSLYSKSIIQVGDKEIRDYPRLKHGGAHLKNIGERQQDIAVKILQALAKAIVILGVLYGLLVWWLSKLHKERYWHYLGSILRGETKTCWREILITLTIVILTLSILFELMPWYHLMGTDKVGHDVFYTSIKSIRTGLLIGTLTTLFMLPLALSFGMAAGFFGGWIDDIIQYLYTTLSSIPGVLLISATILVMQVYISTHAHLFPTLAERADARLLALCLILGVTSWSSLCRLLRAETLKLRELEFVQAAEVLGVRKISIIFRHIMPNLMHIVLITIVLDFSMLVLAEAVLSYVGVGVDPTTFSWGNMINSSRLELAREPIVWWPLASALIFMLILVLSANLFSDAVRDALDPRIRAEIN